MVETEHHQCVRIIQDSFIDRQLVSRLINSLEHCHRMANDFARYFLKCERGAVKQFQSPGDALQEMHLVPFRSLISRPGNSAHFSHGREAVIKLRDIPVGLPWVTPGPVDGNTSFTRGVLAGSMILVVCPWRLEFRTHDCLPFSTVS